MESLEEFDEVVYEPDEAFVESTNVHAFMQEHDIDDHEELIERSTTEVEWFWDELPEYLGIEWYDDYDAVRDDADGPQFTDWYPGGELNVAHNTVDRHAARGSERRDEAALALPDAGGLVAALGTAGGVTVDGVVGDVQLAAGVPVRELRAVGVVTDRSSPTGTPAAS